MLVFIKATIFGECHKYKVHLIQLRMKTVHMTVLDSSRLFTKPFTQIGSPITIHILLLTNASIEKDFRMKSRACLL